MCEHVCVFVCVFVFVCVCVVYLSGHERFLIGITALCFKSIFEIVPYVYQSCLSETFNPH